MSKYTKIKFILIKISLLLLDILAQEIRRSKYSPLRVSSFSFFGLPVHDFSEYDLTTLRSLARRAVARARTYIVAK